MSAQSCKPSGGPRPHGRWLVTPLTRIARRRTMNPYVSLSPLVIVAASAPRPAGPCESAHAPPPGPVPPNTLAASLLHRWLAPLRANKAPAQTPLGQSAWDSVSKTVTASAGRGQRVSGQLSSQAFPDRFASTTRQSLGLTCSHLWWRRWPPPTPPAISTAQRGTEALRVIEASALRTGFQPHLGLTPGQRIWAWSTYRTATRRWRRF